MKHAAEPHEDLPAPSAQPTAPAPSAQPTAPAPSAQPTAPAPSAQPTARSPWRWATLALALVAVVATGVAVWALTRTPTENSSAPTAQEVADAKGRACEAYVKVRTAVALQTQAAVGTDPVAAQAVAANARLAMSVGSQHLVDNLSPAVPAELAGLLRTLATDLQNLTINALAGTPDGDAGQVTRLRDLEANSTKIVEQCK